MTILERVKSIVSSEVELSDEGPASLEKLVYMAYYIGREESAREVSRRYNQHIAEQRARAEKCRCHRMAAEIVGIENYLYSADFSGEMTGAFGSDPADI